MSEQRKASYINSTQQLISEYIYLCAGPCHSIEGEIVSRYFHTSLQTVKDVEIKPYLSQSMQLCTHVAHVNKRHHLYFTT